MDLDFDSDLDFNLPVQTAYSPIRLFDVPDDCLTTVIYVHMLDPDVLLTSITQAAQNLHLHRECPH
jgi:hypothetical protein